MTSTSRPKLGARLLHFVSQRALVLCWAAYAVAIVWLLLHPIVSVTTGELKCRGTYISENALLVAHIVPKADKTQVANIRKRQQSWRRIEPSDGCVDSSDCPELLDWIQLQLEQIPRVQVYRQQLPSNRTNVYAILRASPLADGKESMALVAQYQDHVYHRHEYSGISVGIEMLRYLSSVRWLAKDVIFLCTDDLHGANKWLHAYHADPFTSSTSTLPMHAGVIRAAFSLESSQMSRAIGLKVAGTNGLLPNLDLVNVAIHAGRRDRTTMVIEPFAGTVIVPIFSYLTNLLPQSVHMYMHQLVGMFRFMAAILDGPSGLHAAFLGYNIESITLVGDKSARPLMRTTEFMVRAMSNLEQKMYRSYNLYVLPTPRTFVSVGEYYYNVPIALSPAIAQLLTILSRTYGLRLAFAAVVGTTSVLALASMWIVASISLELTDLWLGLTVGYVLVLAIIRYAMLPKLLQVPVLAGCISNGKEQREDGVYEGDSGWKAIKSLVMTILLIAHCLLGVLNYPLALMCAFPMAFFALIEPVSSASTTKNVGTGVWMLLSSPILLLACDAFFKMQVLTTVVDRFALGMNDLALPYLLFVYLPTHALSFFIWTFPPAPSSSMETQDKKRQ